MYTLVKNLSDIQEAAKDIQSENEKGLDTESYGTRFMDRMFSLQISTSTRVWYFNFHDYSKNWHEPSRRHDVPILNVNQVMEHLSPAFKDRHSVWFIHNSKFDQRRLAIEGKELLGGIHCTQMCERYIYNQYVRYSFDHCLKRRKMFKDDAVAKYIEDHKLKSKCPDTGKTLKHFEQVPFDLMFPYASSDAERVRVLGLDQRKELIEHPYYHNDLLIQRVAYKMEEVGIKVRQDYAQGGYEYELEKAKEVSIELSRLAGEPFRNGPNWLRSIFDKHQVPYRTNPKTGNAMFDKDELDAIDHPIAGLIRKYRKHVQYAGTYYDTYRRHDVIHPEIKLFGTVTNRLSYADPNLQNVPKEKKVAADVLYTVRGCFEPRPEYCFVMIDYNQQEFRMFLDYAGEHELIRKINEEGLDAHDATAEMVGIERDPAKTLNFALIYGVGIEELAKMLGMSVAAAKMLKNKYFARMPKTKRLISAVMSRAETAKKIMAWTGRFMHFPVKDFAYKAPNHLIQGGCADVVRMAMPPIHEYLEDRRSRLVVQVHDELLLEVHESELHLVQGIVDIMENTYKPFNGMRLTCGVSHSWVSWSKRDIIEGYPVPKEVL